MDIVSILVLGLSIFLVIIGFAFLSNKNDPDPKNLRKLMGYLFILSGVVGTVVLILFMMN